MQRPITWMVLVIFSLGIVGCALEPQRPEVYGYSQPYAYPQPVAPVGESVDLQARDTAECQNWAAQQSGYAPSDTLKGAGIGAAVGALGGAALGAAIGAAAGGGSGAAEGAAIGAAAGGIGGAVTGGATTYSRDQYGYNRAYAACMQARGYVVR